MRTLSLILVLTTAVAANAGAQSVTADISILGGPVYGRVVIGHPYPYHAAPVVVPRYHGYHGYGCHYCRPILVRHGPPGLIRRYHRIGAWYHPGSGRYFDQPYAGLRGLRPVSVREYEGRYWFDD